MLNLLSIHTSKGKKIEKAENTLKNKTYINIKLITKLMREMATIKKFNEYLIEHFKSKDYIIFNIVNIGDLLEILDTCIKEQIELHVDNILEHFPDTDNENINLTKMQNAINFIKCFNAINKLPNTKYGYKVWNRPLDINKYQIVCEPKNVNNIKYIICDVFGDKIIFETWRLYLDKYII